MAILAMVVLSVFLGGRSPAPAGAAGAGAVCRAACAARSVPVSCRWLAAKPRRCTHRAVRACKRLVRDGLPAACPAPADLPACLTNHGCPYGALCADGVCQVVACGPDLPPCAGSTTCDGDKCVVGACSGSTENCPAGFHCEGVCVADDPGVDYCTTDAACITPGEFDRVCRGGVCGPRGRKKRRAATTTTSSSTTSTAVASSTSTTVAGGEACFDLFDCSGLSVCCDGQCRPDPYPGMGVCSTLYTPACTLCASDDDCACAGIFCDACEGTASLSGCVAPCP